MAEKKTFQRLGIERLIEGGDLPIAAGPVMLDVPTPTAPTLAHRERGAMRQCRSLVC